MRPLLELRGVTLFINGKKILNHLDLNIMPGEIHSILGMNGTGKTTLAYTIMGLTDYSPHSGSIIWEGKKINHLSISKRASLGITLGWQEPVRFEGLRVLEYLKIGLHSAKDGLTPGQSLEMVGLDPLKYLRREMDTSLSGGERKRIELAAVLMMQPRLAILDEPDSGIDALSIDNIKQVIRALVRDNASVILITHREDVAAIGDTASVLCGGKILKNGLPADVNCFFRNHCQPCQHINRPTMEEFQNE